MTMNSNPEELRIMHPKPAVAADAATEGAKVYWKPGEAEQFWGHLVEVLRAVAPAELRRVLATAGPRPGHAINPYLARAMGRMPAGRRRPPSFSGLRMGPWPEVRDRLRAALDAGPTASGVGPAPDDTPTGAEVGPAGVAPSPGPADLDLPADRLLPAEVVGAILPVVREILEREPGLTPLAAARRGFAIAFEPGSPLRRSPADLEDVPWLLPGLDASGRSSPDPTPVPPAIPTTPVATADEPGPGPGPDLALVESAPAIGPARPLDLGSVAVAAHAGATWDVAPAGARPARPATAPRVGSGEGVAAAPRPVVGLTFQEYLVGLVGAMADELRGLRAEITNQDAALRRLAHEARLRWEKEVSAPAAARTPSAGEPARKLRVLVLGMALNAQRGEVRVRARDWPCELTCHDAVTGGPAPKGLGNYDYYVVTVATATHWLPRLEEARVPKEHIRVVHDGINPVAGAVRSAADARKRWFREESLRR
jgi:hypothetical protein